MGADFPVAPEALAGNPAPLWFLLGFKVLGFVLHMAPMHLLLAGSGLAALCALSGGEHPRRLAGRLARVLPVAVALAVNFGVLPLLFMQVVYYPVFYPATILMGWLWFAVIPLAILAYAGIYVRALNPQGSRWSRAGTLGSVTAAVLYPVIGLILASAMTLLASPDRMLAAYDSTRVAAAVSGLATNLADPATWARWLMMAGLALTTTAAWIRVDAGLLSGSEAPGYREWAGRFAVPVFAAGLAVFGTAGTWYVLFILPAGVATAIPGILWALAAFAPVATGLTLVAFRNPGRGTWLVAAVQVVALAAFAVTRQWIQYRQVAVVFDPARSAVRPQYGPLAVFLVLFAAGLATVGYLVRDFRRGRN